MGENNGNGVVPSCCNEPQQGFLYLYCIYWVCCLLVGDTPIAKPMRLLATAIHEISHALACWITGGQVLKLEVYDNTGGVTHYAGGCRCLIAPAGYLGEAVWAFLFVVMSGGRRTATFAAVALIVSLLGSLCYKPNRVLVMLTVAYVVITLAVLGIDWWLYNNWNSEGGGGGNDNDDSQSPPVLTYLILLFGVFIATYACSDICSHLILNSRQGSDSYTAYEETGRCVPPRCIGVCWLLLALTLQFAGVWFALILMSDECRDQGWFECVFHSKFEMEQFKFDDWWPFDGDWDR